MKHVLLLSVLPAAVCWHAAVSPAFTVQRPCISTARRAALTPVVAQEEGSTGGGPLASLRAKLPPGPELKKVLPLGLMFFCILFSYTILRDTKDVLVVTAPGSGAEIIPFLKTYVNLPGAIGFAALYSNLVNKYPREKVFVGIVGTFITFFALFALVVYPNAAFLHPTGFCTWLAGLLPAGFAAPIAILRNWTYAVFYTMAELWGSVVVSLLFWGWANEVTSVSEAKKYYPLFGLGANVALIFSGIFVRYVSGLRRAAVGVGDPWAQSLRLLMGGVVVAGGGVLALFRYMTTQVMTDPACVDQAAQKKAKTKTSMGLKESASYLANSPYIRNLAALVICYGMSINIVEVSWKAKLKAAFPNPNDYSEFMGAFSSTTGTVTLFMMLLSRKIFKVFGWGVAALVTPTVLALTAGVFFSLTIFESAAAPIVAALGTTPLMLAVIVGALQNIFSKSAKYSLFDPCKEMAYIPLDPESKTKGKAAVDVIGNPLGKSGGSFVQQGMIFAFGSLAVSTPYLAAVLAVIMLVWIRSARALNIQFKEAMAEQGLEE